MELLGKRVEFNGSIGTITVVTRDTERVVVEFYDGKHADPDDPKFPVYSLLVNIADLEPLDNAARRKDTP